MTILYKLNFITLLTFLVERTLVRSKDELSNHEKVFVGDLRQDRLNLRVFLLHLLGLSLGMVRGLNQER